MSKVNKTTKQGSLSQMFKQAAVTDPKGALAYMFMSAFGVSLEMLTTLLKKMMEGKDVDVVMLAVTAGVQIRNHAVFVGSEYAGVRTKYPELIIEGVRDQQDQFNFGALHSLGHLMAHCTKHAFGKKALSKSGSCITGEMVTDSEAGKINKEIYEGWTTDDKSACSDWRSANSAALSAFLDPVFASISGDSKAFNSRLNPVKAADKPKVPAPPSASSNVG